MLSLSLKDCKQTTFSGVIGQVKTLLQILCDSFVDLALSEKISENDTKAFRDIWKGVLDDPDDLSRALSVIIRCLSIHTGKKVIVLIDEYDTPIHAAYANGYYQEIVEFMRIFLGSALKDQDALVQEFRS